MENIKEIRKVQFWAETNMGRLERTNEFKFFVFVGDEDFFAEVIDEALLTWVAILRDKNMMDFEREYGWKYLTPR